MDVTRLTGGGAPTLGEPLPIELANATYAVRGRPQDGLRTVEHFAAWLRDMRPRLAVPVADADLAAVTDADLAAARELRGAIRELAHAAVTGDRPDPGALEVLNRLVRTAPRWRELRWDGDPHAEARSASRPVTAALAGIAEGAVELFSGPDRGELRACQGPGCVLYFLKDHPRREWCSAGCGNRARAARHYDRTRRSSG